MYVFQLALDWLKSKHLHQPSDGERHLTEIKMHLSELWCLQWLLPSPAVPAALNETLPVTSKRIEVELSASQGLAWKYTAVLEKKLAQGETQRQGGEPPLVLLRQALYNVRQHEVFLKKLLVGRRPFKSFIYLFGILIYKTYTWGYDHSLAHNCISHQADALVCGKRVEILQGELSSKMKMLQETVRGKTAVHTAQVFVSTVFYRSVCLPVYKMLNMDAIVKLALGWKQINHRKGISWA